MCADSDSIEQFAGAGPDPALSVIRAAVASCVDGQSHTPDLEGFEQSVTYFMGRPRLDRELRRRSAGAASIPSKKIRYSSANGKNHEFLGQYRIDRRNIQLGRFHDYLD